MAVYPYAEVQVAIHAARDAEPRLVIHPENFGERYEVRRDAPPWGPHPLLEAAIAYMKVPRDLRLEVTIHSEAPAGAGTGTSAAVTVALVGALDALTPGRLTPHEVAAAAQRVETEMLGRQCGIQDQLASAYGGINYIEMFVYPHASVSPVLVPTRCGGSSSGASSSSTSASRTTPRPSTRPSSARWRTRGRTPPPSSTCAAPRRARATRSTPATSPPSGAP